MLCVWNQLSRHLYIWVGNNTLPFSFSLFFSFFHSSLFLFCFLFISFSISSFLLSFFFSRVDNIQPHSTAHPKRYSHIGQDISPRCHEVSTEQSCPGELTSQLCSPLWYTSFLSLLILSYWSDSKSSYMMHIYILKSVPVYNIYIICVYIYGTIE